MARTLPAASFLPKLDGRPALGIGLMVLATLSTTTQDAMGKWLVAAYPVVQVAWARYFIACLILVVLGLRVGPHRLVRTAHPRLQLLRGVLVFSSTLCLWAGLRTVPLADAVAILFVAPLLVTIMAIPILGEEIGWRRWTAVAVGLLGVLIVLRPGAGLFRLDAAFILLASFNYALYQALTRKIAAQEDPYAQQFYTAVVGAVVLTIVLPWQAAPVIASAWPWFILLGAVGVLSHYLITTALACAPASVLSPFLYTQLLWATAVGWLVFNDWPDRTTLLGGAVIAASGLYVFYREAVRRARAQPERAR